MSKYKDVRVKEKIKETVRKIISGKTIKLWRIAEDKREYERMRTLFNGELKTVLDDKKVSETLREMSVEGLGREEVVIALHDPCDIRKEYAEKLENLGVVRNLKGKFVSGYNTFNTVCVDAKGQQLHLSDISVYSNGDKTHFVKQEELDELVKKQVASVKKKVAVEYTEREKAILQLLEKEEVVNVGRVTRKQLQAVSDQFKAANPEVEMWHVLDRQFDGAPLFEFITHNLEDKCVIRLKISRNSNATYMNDAGKESAVKLKDVPLIGSQTDVLDKVRCKKKVYQQAKRILEWGTLVLDDEIYHVVRVTLQKRDGTPIFKQPMLLLTNHPVTTAADALSIYRIYLMRSKIEDVFKFVKNALGWEQFQVRDWESIKNLIATAFFIGGYFYKIEPHLADHPVLDWLCQLGNGKGKVTRHFLLEGLRYLLIHQHVELIRQQSDLSDPDWHDILSFSP